MKITYRECDACGERVEYRKEQFPPGWAALAVCGGEAPELCPKCIQPLVDAVAKRKKP